MNMREVCKSDYYYTISVIIQTMKVSKKIVMKNFAKKEEVIELKNQELTIIEFLRRMQLNYIQRNEKYDCFEFNLLRLRIQHPPMQIGLWAHNLQLYKPFSVVIWAWYKCYCKKCLVSNVCNLKYYGL